MNETASNGDERRRRTHGRWAAVAAFHPGAWRVHRVCEEGVEEGIKRRAGTHAAYSTEVKSTVFRYVLHQAAGSTLRLKVGISLHAGAT